MTRKFTLQRVLDFKEQIEDLLQIEVAAIEGRRIELQHTVDNLRRKWNEVGATHASPLPGNGAEPLDPALVEAIADYLDVLDRRIRSGDETLQQVRQELDAKRGDLEVAYQERELLERLKQKQAALERKAEQRRDVRAVEDTSTSQYVRRNGNGHRGDGADDGARPHSRGGD